MSENFTINNLRARRNALRGGAMMHNTKDKDTEKSPHNNQFIASLIMNSNKSFMNDSRYALVHLEFVIIFSYSLEPKKFRFMSPTERK